MRRFHLLVAFVVLAPACASIVGFPDVPDLPDSSAGGEDGEPGGADQEAGSGKGSAEMETGADTSHGSDANSAGEAAAMPSMTLIDRCSTGTPNGLSPASVKALLAGGSAGLRLLYPYAQTVFPRGLIAPTVMWDGAFADYVYVHLKSNSFEYKGCVAPSAPGQVQLPQDVWAQASVDTAGGSDPLSLSLTTISSGTVTGPVTENIVIATATLKGSIYYNSYMTKLLDAGSGGAVLRIAAGQMATPFLGSSGCTGCHAVSANGTRMVADPLTSNISGATYALVQQTSSNPAPLVSNAPNATFVGVYPDGSLYVGNAHPNGGFGGPRAGGPGATGPVNAALYETDTGNVVNNSGIPTGAMMPMFSPDGSLLVFNDFAISTLPDGGKAPEGLATMSFNKASRIASNYKQTFHVSDMSTYPGWPFFLPDNRGVVFAIGSASDYSGNGAGLSAASMGVAGAPTSDLFILDLASGTSTVLGQAMGFATSADVVSNTTYLPFGASEELHHNYDPTVSAVAAGGYFWLFFDSYRHYGNQGLKRQLWGAAIDVSGTGAYLTDPSHPAFFVTGQELGTGNHRAFATLDPCQSDGASCTAGVECCGGFCTNGACGKPSPRCSNLEENCGSGQACCDPAVMCIGGFCSTINP
jgi:hypothetical protein